MMTMLGRRRRRKLLSGPVLFRTRAVIFITSPERGLTWMTASDRRLFRNWRDGQHPQAGYRAFGPVAQMSRSHQNERMPEMVAMARQWQWARSRNGDRSREIEQMESVVGKRMYRGLLKTVARVWNPRDIQDPAIQEKVLAHMQAAERGLRRAEAAREKAGLAAFAAVLGSLKLSSLEQVDNLKTLQEIVIALEGRAPEPDENRFGFPLRIRALLEAIAYL